MNMLSVFYIYTFVCVLSVVPRQLGNNFTKL